MKLKTIELLKWIIHFFIVEIPIIIKCKIQDRRFIYNGNRMCQFDVPIFLTRFTHALNTPIHNRCAELTILIDRCSSKDLQNIFPTLIENIFGTSGGVCWGLRNITQSSHPNEFTVLHHFLGPLGPLFRLIYKLLTDSQVKYEYSVAHLPNKVRQILENSKIPPFYTDLLNIETQSRKVHSLCLNSFDYYMFHFAYHLTNVWQQRTNNAWSVWNTVYYVLSCDYMLHFLPTDPNIIILPRLIHFTGKNPTIIPPPSVTNRPQYTSKLFRNHVLQQTSTDISALHQPMQQHPRSEIWRSETVVQIFIDMWLNNDQINNVDSSFNLQSKINQLPTGEYIRIIRVFVKQLHAFSASGRLDTSPLGELKKIVQPMLQGPIYAFLRHLVYRWPLDGSFRLVLELWLSYIQPWRYLGDNQIRNQENEIEDLNTSHVKLIDPHYIGFIADNLLAYTVIFQQLLPRFSRIDLSSPKNSLMLFRVCKVFGQPNLVAMIREIEACIHNINHSPTHSYNPMGTTILPPLSPTSCWSTNTATTYHHIHAETDSLNYQTNRLNIHNTSSNTNTTTTNTTATNNDGNNSNINNNNKWAAIVRHRIYELEGSEFCYKPIFVGRAAPEIFELLKQIELAEPIARNIIKERLEQSNKEYSNMFSSFFKMLFEIEDTNNDEFTLDERKKVPVFLSTSKMNLMEMFELQNENVRNNMENITTENVTTMHEESFWNNSFSSNIDLTPNGARLRAKNLKYEGDPDLHPIKSNENAFLVRILYNIAQKINDANNGKFSALYFRSDFIGRISRQILCSPLLTHTYDKQRTGGYSPRVSKTLPPRLSLRFFANHTFLAYFIIGFLLFRYHNYGLFAYIFILIFIWFLFVIIKAIFERKQFNRFHYNVNLENISS